MNNFFYRVQAVLVIASLCLVTACVAPVAPTDTAPAADSSADSDADSGSDNDAAMEVDYTATYPITEDIEGPCSYAATDAKDYSGRTLNVITFASESTPLHGASFAELTGATINILYPPFDFGQELMGGTHDVMFYATYQIADMYPLLEPVPAAYLDMAQMQDVTANYMDVATLNGEVVQYPVDGDRHILKYRTDIMEDADIQAAYKEATGNDLRVPQTWKEYGEQAAFFNGQEINGEEIFGSAEVTNPNDFMFSAFISRVAPYAKHPDVTGGFFFDLETMTPLVNTPGWVEGLTDFIAVMDSFPPGGDNFGLGDEIVSFAGGETVFSYSWDEAFITAMEEDSDIRNQVKMAPVPGANRVWNRDTEQWDEFDEPNRAPYIAWGWAAAVAKTSTNQEMAFDYLCFYTNPANQVSDMLAHRNGVNTYRYSDMHADIWIDGAGYDKDVAQSVIDTYTFLEASQNRVFDLRIPGVQQYMTSLAMGAAKAMSGEADPQTALDEVAAEWETITDAIGRDAQRTAYENVVKLEDNVASR
ncbi:MAG: ABC transporter substrate-binding protein [Chloroflexota bacterium]